MQATSLEEESFIHPPSPIQGEVMMGRFNNNETSKKEFFLINLAKNKVVQSQEVNKDSF